MSPAKKEEVNSITQTKQPYSAEEALVFRVALRRAEIRWYALQDRAGTHNGCIYSIDYQQWLVDHEHLLVDGNSIYTFCVLTHPSNKRLEEH